MNKLIEAKQVVAVAATAVTAKHEINSPLRQFQNVPLYKFFRES